MDHMIRHLPLALLLVSCGPAAQRDAALAVIATSASAVMYCGLEQHDSGQGRACVVVGTVVTIGGGMALHAQIEEQSNEPQK